jgi:hypothetical protein
MHYAMWLRVRVPPQRATERTQSGRSGSADEQAAIEAIHVAAVCEFRSHALQVVLGTWWARSRVCGVQTVQRSVRMSGISGCVLQRTQHAYVTMGGRL